MRKLRNTIPFCLCRKYQDLMRPTLWLSEECMRDKFAGGKLARQMWMVNPQTMLTLNVMQDMLRFGPP